MNDQWMIHYKVCHFEVDWKSKMSVYVGQNYNMERVGKK